MTRYVEDIKFTFLSGHPFHGEILLSDLERIAAEIVEAYDEVREDYSNPEARED